MRKRIGKYRQAGEARRKIQELWEAYWKRGGEGEKREERRASWMWWILPFWPVFSFPEDREAFSLLWVLSRFTLTGSLYVILCHIERFINISQFSSASPPLKRLLPGSEDYRPSQFFCLLYKPSQSGENKNVYVSQVPNPPYAVPGTTLKQETKHLTSASIHLGIFVSPPSICSTPPAMKLLLQFTYSAIAFIVTANLSQSVSLGGTCTSSSDVRDIFSYIWREILSSPHLLTS